eukprot:11116432-Prorocentrum_lima.AAC.1
MGQTRGHAQMLQQRLAAEIEDRRRQQEIIEQIAESALLSRVNQIEARAETDRQVLSGQVKTLEELYQRQIGEVTDKTEKERQMALQRIIDSTRSRAMAEIQENTSSI